MYKYQCLNPIAEVGLSKFTKDYQKVEDGEVDAYLVRSANMKEMEMPSSVKAIARAGAGVNNIPVDACAEKGIVVFNTPGANANGVKELVIAGMLLAARDIVGGINWLKDQEPVPEIQKLAEKQKSHFAGTEIQGKRLGVIGLGAIGVQVANAALSLGMEVYGYDPYLSVNAAWGLSRSVVHVNDVNDIYRDCDFITIHVPLLDSTRGMIGEEAIGQMKRGVIILNLARDPLADEKAVLAGLKSGVIRKYVTDFATPALLQAENTIVIPHLGASTEESEDNCAVMAVNELKEYLENGSIRNSVNYPTCEVGACQSAGRIAINHKNVPNMIAQFTKVLADEGMNITDFANKSRGDYAYSVIDTSVSAGDHVKKALEAIDGVLRVRIVK